MNETTIMSNIDLNILDKSMLMLSEKVKSNNELFNNEIKKCLIMFDNTNELLRNYKFDRIHNKNAFSKDLTEIINTIELNEKYQLHIQYSLDYECFQLELSYSFCFHYMSYSELKYFDCKVNKLIKYFNDDIKVLCK